MMQGLKGIFNSRIPPDYFPPIVSNIFLKNTIASIPLLEYRHFFPLATVTLTPSNKFSLKINK